MNVPSFEEALAKAKAVGDDTPAESLPAATEIRIDVTDRRGHRYVHDFYYKVPMLGDRMDIGTATQAFLPNGPTPNQTANMLANIAAYLAVTIQFEGKYKKPKWWNMWKCYDATPFQALYAEVMAYEARFLGIPVDGAAGDGAEDSGSEGSSDGPDSDDVGGDVQAPPVRSKVVIAERG